MLYDEERKDQQPADSQEMRLYCRGLMRAPSRRLYTHHAQAVPDPVRSVAPYLIRRTIDIVTRASIHSSAVLYVRVRPPPVRAAAVHWQCSAVRFYPRKALRIIHQGIIRARKTPLPTRRRHRRRSEDGSPTDRPERAGRR